MAHLKPLRPGLRAQRINLAPRRIQLQQRMINRPRKLPTPNPRDVILPPLLPRLLHQREHLLLRLRNLLRPLAVRVPVRHDFYLTQRGGAEVRVVDEVVADENFRGSEGSRGPCGSAGGLRCRGGRSHRGDAGEFSKVGGLGCGKPRLRIASMGMGDDVVELWLSRYGYLEGCEGRGLTFPS